MSINKKNICFISLFLLLTFSFRGIAQNDSLQKAVEQSNRWKKNANYFSEGLKYRLSGDIPKAIDNFEKALHFNSEDHASMYEMTEAYALMGNIDKAIEYISNAIKIDTDNKWYKIRLAQLYKYQGNYENYVLIYRDLLKTDPTNVDYFGELSAALTLLERYDEAIEVLNDIEKEIGIKEPISLQKQKIYFDTGKPKKGIEEIEKLAEAYPYEQRYWAMLAELYMKNNRSDDALKVYNKIVELNPKDPYVHISLSEYYTNKGDLEKSFEELLIAFENPELDIETKIQILSFWFEGKKRTEIVNNQARAIGNALIKTHPNSPRGYQLLGDVYYGEQKFAEAAKNFETSLAIDSSSYFIWENLLLAEINTNQENYSKIGMLSERALKLFPEQPLLYYFSGVAFYTDKNYELALKRFETGSKFVVRNDALLEDFYNRIGDLQHLLGNNQAAYVTYDKILKINPNNSLVLNNYAYYLSLEDAQLEKALQMSAKSVELDSENPSNLDTYAWVFYKLGRYEDALKWIEKAIEKSEKPSGTLVEHLGDILYRLDRKQEAVQKWKEAKKIGETSEFIERKIKDGILYE